MTEGFEREKGKGRREKGKGRREKWKRQKAEGSFCLF
jgi:hypothetical protein